MSKPETIMIDDVKYIREDAVQEPSESVNGLQHCIVRTYSAGVFAGYIKSRDGQEGVLLNARRLWRWSGAASLSQLAVEGTKNPGGCKFPVEVPELTLTNIIEIIPTSKKAKDSIDSVLVWSA